MFLLFEINFAKESKKNPFSNFGWIIQIRGFSMKKNTGALLVGTLFLTLGAAAFGIVENDNNVSQVTAAADDPAAYWSTLTATDGSVYGNTFRQQLETIMINKGSTTGTNSYSALNTILGKSDTNGTDSVMAFYRDHSASSSWNKEHCWPNSRGAGENQGYAGTDPQVIRPTNSSDNSSRSNYMYGEVANPTTATYSQSTGWDPAAFGYEGARGEAARIILYTAVRYYNKSLSGAGGSYNGSATSMELTNNLNDATTNGTMGKLSDLLHWNDEYPVTDVETYRNNYLSGAITGSTYDYCRNPFIDHPEWANYIWDANGIRTSAYSTTSVSVASSSVSVNKGSNVTDQATANQFASSVSWSVSSSDSSVATATVSSSGLVTIHGVKGGSATVTVSGTDGTTTKTAVIAVTVLSTDPTVTVSDSSMSLKVGTNGTTTLSSSNFSGAVSYSVASSTSSVATGSVSGTTLTVVPLSVGSATLTITATYGSETATATIDVTVAEAVTSTTIIPTTTNMPTAYPTTPTSYSLEGLDLTLNYVAVYSGVIQFKASQGYMLNSAPLNAISSLVIVYNSPTETSVPTITCGSSSALGTTVTPDISGSTYTYTLGGATYFKIMANTNAGKISSLTFNFGSSSKTLSSLEVTTPPTKTSYFVGDTLNTNGLVVTANYEDSTTSDVTSLCSYNPTNLTLAGAQTVTASYGGKTATFSVNVSVNSLSSIAISSTPSKTAYHVGEAFASAGLEVTATFASGSTSDVTSLCTLDPADGTVFSSAGNPTITVSYTSGAVTKTASFTVTVTTAPALSSIAVTTQPTKTSYTVGQTFDTTGLVVTGTYSDSSTADVTSFCTLSPASGSTLNNAGSQTVLVTYLGKAATFNVTVAAAGEGKAYNLITDASGLVSGSNYLICTATTGDGFVMGSTCSGSYYNNIGYSFSAGQPVTLDTGMLPLTLGGSAGAWTFGDTVNGGSLYTSAAKSLKFNATASTWTISVAATGVATITCTTSSYGSLEYNAAAPRFTTYTPTSNQSPVYLYVQSSGSSDTSATEASSWAANFVAAINPNCDSIQQAAKTPDATFVSTWANQKTAFESLSEAAQTLVKDDASSEANIVSARTLYKFILGKYGTASLNNFLAADIPSASLAPDLVSPSSEEGVLLVAGILLAMGIGGIFLLRRKKVN